MSSVTSYICPTCGANLPSEEGLAGHTANAHRAERGVYTCPKCGAKFGELIALKRHAAQAHGG